MERAGEGRLAFSLRATGIKAARPMPKQGRRLMPARRVTTVTSRSRPGPGSRSRPTGDRTPLLTIWATRPALLVTLTLPERIEPGHVRFARQLASSAAAYAAEVERRYRALPGPPAPRR